VDRADSQAPDLSPERLMDVDVRPSWDAQEALFFPKSDASFRNQDSVQAPME
jgi:hypothetical protein